MSLIVTFMVNSGLSSWRMVLMPLLSRLLTLLVILTMPLFLARLTLIPIKSLSICLRPNLGGFFMVRSYYPSECHADYFDFERIEALKPAIEACGISTLSQSPMLGFHKQMDNRIKLLEEILSFRMQGVE